MIVSDLINLLKQQAYGTHGDAPVRVVIADGEWMPTVTGITVHWDKMNGEVRLHLSKRRAKA